MIKINVFAQKLFFSKGKIANNTLTKSLEFMIVICYNAVIKFEKQIKKKEGTSL